MNRRIRRVQILVMLMAPLLLTAVLFAMPAQAQETSLLQIGHWEQDLDETNGPEPLLWRVLDRTDEAVLLLSEKGLAAQPYQQRWREVTWETCDLRSWLSEIFLQEAFTEEERTQILSVPLTNPPKPTYQTKGGEATEDQIFLLSFEEVSRYLPTSEDRVAEATPAAVAAGVRVKPNGHCSWWLRTPGRKQYHAATVTTSGDYYDFFDVTCKTNAIRPAMWVHTALTEREN